MAVPIGANKPKRLERQDFDEQLVRAENFRQCAIEQFETNRAAAAASLDLAASTLRLLGGLLRRDGWREKG